MINTLILYKIFQKFFFRYGDLIKDGGRLYRLEGFYFTYYINNYVRSIFQLTQHRTYPLVQT
jgi:hypothetical protein